MGSFVRNIIDTLKRTPTSKSTASRMDNLDALLRAEDQNASMMEIETFVDELSSYGRRMDRLTEPQKRLVYVTSLVADVMNGGFNQYYSNGYGCYAHQAVDALQEIGALKTAHIVRQANELLPDKHVPLDQSAREDIVLRIDEDLQLWESLDTQFFAYPDDINALFIEYIKKHRSEF
ncbi:MAG: DMP19 family protein [Bacteroidetes bacterium]|nr:DMP19 family protein [Bacteroidota bacterium]